MSDNKYHLRGVSSGKEDVHAAIKNIDKGLFARAFCKIVPDNLTGSNDHCLVMHADGAGTKSALAYMYWKETGDLSVWKGIAQDAVIMNLDDLICVGAIENILLSSTIGRNKNLIPAEVLSFICFHPLMNVPVEMWGISDEVALASYSNSLSSSIVYSSVLGGGV